MMAPGAARVSLFTSVLLRRPRTRGERLVATVGIREASLEIEVPRDIGRGRYSRVRSTFISEPAPSRRNLRSRRRTVGGVPVEAHAAVAQRDPRVVADDEMIEEVDV